VFENVGWPEILVLVLAGLFILGPERLPSAAAWLGRNVRKVREYASGARDQLKSELGPEYDELRKPLEDLQRLRGFNPRAAMTKHLFDDIDADGAYKPNGHPGPTGNNGTNAAPETKGDNRPLEAGEKPPLDPDLT
jgi:sec-independent protein translocase protein TatB